MNSYIFPSPIKLAICLHEEKLDETAEAAVSAAATTKIRLLRLLKLVL
jgi:hypothetical protein